MSNGVVCYVENRKELHGMHHIGALDRALFLVKKRKTKYMLLKRLSVR